MTTKRKFETALKSLVEELRGHVSTKDGQWAIKGFIDAFQNIYTVSSDTKVVSKILEIHLFPKIMEFANRFGYEIVPADHQNYYPDVSFVKAGNKKVKFAVDFKTTYRIPKKSYLCNGFTLGSHGKYFEDRASTKNIQFPYASYSGHFCLGIIYSRAGDSAISEMKVRRLSEIDSIVSVINNFEFFVAEKWRIASDKPGSGNTANIGSIQNIADILAGNGMFAKLGESWFDDYWMNYGKITVSRGRKGTSKISTLEDFVKYRKGDVALVVPKRNRKAEKTKNEN